MRFELNVFLSKAKFHKPLVGILISNLFQAKCLHTPHRGVGVEGVSGAYFRDLSL